MPRASHLKAVLWAFVECDVAEFVCRSVDYSILLSWAGGKFARLGIFGDNNRQETVAARNA